jgi:hypothetical protein
MAGTPRKYAPVSPYLMVDDGDSALDFYKRAFAAEILETYPWEGKLGHATLAINGGEVMISDEFPVEMTGVRSPKSLGGDELHGRAHGRRRRRVVRPRDLRRRRDRAPAHGRVLRPVRQGAGSVRAHLGHRGAGAGPGKRLNVAG